MVGEGVRPTPESTVHAANSTSIGSAVFVGLTVVSISQTHRQTHIPRYVANSWPHSHALYAIRLTTTVLAYSKLLYSNGSDSSHRRRRKDQSVVLAR